MYNNNIFSWEFPFFKGKPFLIIKMIYIFVLIVELHY